jgi:hypothetical protein
MFSRPPSRPTCVSYNGFAEVTATVICEVLIKGHDFSSRATFRSPLSDTTNNAHLLTAPNPPALYAVGSS